MGAEARRVRRQRRQAFRRGGGRDLLASGTFADVLSTSALTQLPDSGGLQRGEERAWTASEKWLSALRSRLSPGCNSAQPGSAVLK